MTYRIIREDDIYNAEFDFRVSRGVEFEDGEIEPDLVAEWIARGWVVDLNAQPKRSKKPTINS